MSPYPTSNDRAWNNWQINRTYNDEDDYQGHTQLVSPDSSSEEEGIFDHEDRPWLDHAEDRLAELEARLPDVMRRNLTEARLVRNRLVRNQNPVRASSSTEEAGAYAVNTIRLAREVVGQHHRSRLVIRGDEREDSWEEGSEPVYAEQREEYLENTPCWEIPHELFVGGRDFRTPDSRGFRTPDSSSASSAPSFEYEDTPCEGPQTSLDQPLQFYIGDDNETEPVINPNVPALPTKKAPAVPATRGIRYWLADTGCPVDLVSEKTLPKTALSCIEEAAVEQNFDTANSELNADRTVRIQIEGLYDDCDPYVRRTQTPLQIRTPSSL